jgi:hypothetical protein
MEGNLSCGYRGVGRIPILSLPPPVLSKRDFSGQVSTNQVGVSGIDRGKPGGKVGVKN